MRLKNYILRPDEALPGTVRQHSIAWFVVIGIGIVLTWESMTLAGLVLLAVLSLAPLYGLTLDRE